MDHNYDVIIVGSGAAGMYAALQLPSYCKVLLVCKQELPLCNSSLAQGGIAGVYRSPEDDSPELHQQDTMIAGGQKNDPEAVRILTTEAAMAIDALLKLGANFDKKSDGMLDRTLEGGHCRRRIFHHKDTTGEEIVRTLHRNVRLRYNISILEYAMMVGLQKTGTGFSINILKNDRFMVYNSHFVILATGGIGRMYAYTTNSKIATGDGIAFAHDMGATIKGLHLIQFHPTAFNDHHTRECFLISEAVRGEGAYLLNCNKERFMDRYDDRLELAPRDVVSHAIIEEQKRTGSDYFYLDISHKDPDFVRNRFPMIHAKVLEQGYDMSKEPIPIYPCQHYLMGGIQVDTNAETNVSNLYAVGECSNTGVHGNNRLASNSLLEALVFSRRAALNIAEKLPVVSERFTSANFPEIANRIPMPSGIRTEIREIMQKSYFVIPHPDELKASMNRIQEIRLQLYMQPYAITSDLIEARSMATNAYLILKEVLSDEK